MKAAVLQGIGKIEQQNIPEPELKNDTDVVVRIKMVGVCGSDIHYYTTGRIGSQVVQYPFIVGHEVAGVIERVGDKVTRLKPGQRVAIDPAIYCGNCDQCLSGRENTCRNLLFMGNPNELQGALCEYIIHDEKSCYPIDDEITFEQAVMSEPLAIAVFAVEQSQLVNTANIAIIGAGPIGMSVFHVLRTKEVGNVYVTDKIQERLDLSQSLNPAWSGNPDITNVTQEILSREPQLLDTVFECSGDPQAYEQAVELLKPGGVLSIIGIPETDNISLPIHSLRRKEITLKNIRRQAACTQKAIEYMKNGRINVDSMVTHHFTLEDTQSAFDLVSGYKDGVMKAMITID